LKTDPKPDDLSGPDGFGLGSRSLISMTVCSNAV